MHKHILEANNFKLIIELERFSEEYTYNDTIMHISIMSSRGDGYSSFSGSSDMEIDLKEFIKFSNDLKNLYNNLKGTAIIKECFLDQYIEFSGDGRGHIRVKGYFCSNDEFDQKLSFSNSFEQTYLQKFVNELINDYSYYFAS